LVVALVAVACGSSSATSSSKKPAKAVFDIGVIEDETGSNSTTNQPQVNGLVAWDHFVNTTGGIDGHSVHLDICDAQSSVTGAVACASRVSGDGIIVENGLTGEMAAATPIVLS